MNPFSVIDQGLTVEGEVGAGGRLVVRGTVRGRLRGDHVVIAREGIVCGEVRAQRIDVAGALEGQVEVNGSIHILETGRCSGQIRCHALQLDAGAALDAAVACTRQPEPLMETDAPAEQSLA